ncbi:MAG: (deoxy)nucleoside triphosphate pyrophosphohydrolase [Bdellovibrionota bacterium]
MERPLVVCAAIILNDSSGKELILTAKRLPDAKLEAGKWEFPGGKLEFGEQPEECLVREIKEELGLNVRVEELFDVVSHVYVDSVKKAHILLLVYLCRTDETEVQLIEAADAKWITIEEADGLNWAAADLSPLEKLKKRSDHLAMKAR